MKYYREILLLEAIIFFTIWLWNYYIATLLTFIIVPVCGLTLAVSVISEMLDKSNVSKKYFLLMAGLTLIPILIYIIMNIANEGTSLDWGKP